MSIANKSIIRRLLSVVNDMKNILKGKNIFQLFRIYTFIFSLSLMGVLFLSYLSIHQINLQHHINEAEHDAIGISQAIFQHEKDVLLTLGSNGEMILRPDPKDFARIDKSMRKFLVPLNIIKIKIFSKNTEIVYSTDHAIIGQVDANNEKLNRALNGEVVSKMEKKDVVWDLVGEQKFDIDLVETYLPVRDENNNIIGSFELYLNIARYQDVIEQTTKLSIMILAIILLLVFGFLSIIMRKGTKLLNENEQMLKEASKENITILNTAIDGFWINDRKGRFLDVNNSYCKIVDYTKDELLTMSIQDIEAMETPENTAQHIKRIIEQGYERFETRHKHKDGRIIDIEVSANYIRETELFFVFLRDITEKKKVENQLKTHAENIEKINKTFIGRELKMVELKKEIDELKKRQKS